MVTSTGKRCTIYGIEKGGIEFLQFIDMQLNAVNITAFTLCQVIHADIATRNVLLLRKDCVKRTDFGLSRRLNDYSNYVKQHQVSRNGLTPIKPMKE